MAFVNIAYTREFTGFDSRHEHDTHREVNAMQLLTIPADPTMGQTTTAMDTIQDFALVQAAPMLFVITLLGVLVGVGLRYVKRAGHRL